MSHSTNSKILYVDDDSDDCVLLSESFAATTKASLVCSSNGEDAINYLNMAADDELPCLIILDLNMPKWDGRQTLNYIKSNPHLSQIPVIILSTSENKLDKEICKRLGATSYFQKPFHYDGYKEIVNYCIPLLNVTPPDMIN